MEATWSYGAPDCLTKSAGKPNLLAMAQLVLVPNMEELQTDFVPN